MVRWTFIPVQKSIHCSCYPCSPKKNLKKNIIWNFFATSNGKGPVDGIGGAIKHLVRNYVKTHKGNVFNAADFTSAAQVMSSDVKIIQMKTSEIEERNEALNMHSIFEEAVPLDNIKKMHCIYIRQDIVEGAFLTKKIIKNPEGLQMSCRAEESEKVQETLNWVLFS